MYIQRIHQRAVRNHASLATLIRTIFITVIFETICTGICVVEYQVLTPLQAYIQYVKKWENVVSNNKDNLHNLS